jgi:4-alpha-glucanotransferase
LRVSDRHAGLLVPLFSMRSTGSWGIGELPDLATFARWLASASVDRLLFVPIGPLFPGAT